MVIKLEKFYSKLQSARSSRIAIIGLLMVKFLHKIKPLFKWMSIHPAISTSFPYTKAATSLSTPLTNTATLTGTPTG